MNKSKLFIYVFAACIFQLILLSGMVLKAYYPLWSGDEVIFKVIARDPRDIFRGHFVALNYDYSNLDLSKVHCDLPYDQKFEFGDIFYLELSKEKKYHVVKKICLNPQDDSKLYMKVYNQRSFTRDRPSKKKSYDQFIEVKAGIEEYFTTKEEALYIEEETQKLRNQINISKEDSFLKFIEENYPITVTARIVKSGLFQGSARIQSIQYPRYKSGNKK